MPREDGGISFEARRIVGDLNAGVANGDGLQSTSLERRPFVVADAIHECADDSEADRFVLALLRACADVVLLGTGTLAASPKGTWRVDKAYPESAEAFAELRAARGLPEQPLVAVVTSGVSFDPSHAVLDAGAIVLTTDTAAPGIAETVPAATEVVATLLSAPNSSFVCSANTTVPPNRSTSGAMKVDFAPVASNRLTAGPLV